MTSVRDLVVHQDDLVIATFGRSFWVLDNVTPLRQFEPRAAAADIWLYKPGTAYRVRPGNDESTPLPDDEALAENPPNGAVLDYYLKEKSTAPIQLEVFNSDGRLVRRFASDEQPHKGNPNELSFPSSWVREPQALPAEAGIHRFVWDLRYPLPKGIRTSFWRPSGPLALPGNYTVRLTAHGKSSSQPLTIKMDPRVKTPLDALVRQFELATRISTREGEVSAALQQITELQKQLGARKKEASEKPDVAKTIDELNQKLGAMVAEDSDGGFGLYGLAFPRKEPESLTKIASSLNGLLSIVESADVAPSTDAVTAHAKWDKVAEGALARWADFQNKDLANANGMLQKANLKPVATTEMPTGR